MKKPLFFNEGVDFPIILAPMAGVTDTSFRGICRRMGADFSYTEMVSAKGMHYGNSNTIVLLAPSPDEPTFGVQIFGSEPQMVKEAVKYLDDMEKRPSMIDINMGCPARKIVKNMEGSAMMRNLPLASRVIESAAAASNIPVSVKFRKGWDDENINCVEFAVMAEESGASMLTVHGRTREQFYAGEADWEIIGRVKAAVGIPVIGNGDITSGADAIQIRNMTGCDGIMIGRGARGNPFIFGEIKAAIGGREYRAPGPVERIDMAIEHVRILCGNKGAGGVCECRKHVAWYISGMNGAAKIRLEVNKAENAQEILDLLGKFRLGFLDKG